MRIWKTKEEFKKLFAEKAEVLFEKSVKELSGKEVYQIIANMIKDLISEDWIQTEKTYNRKKVRQVYYFSIEFLLGRLLNTNLLNCDAEDICRSGLKDMGFDLEEIFPEEPDPGLGNGGLGRLAALPELDERAAREREAQLLQAKQQTARRLQALLTRIEIHRELSSQLCAKADELGALSERHAWVKVLSDTAEGSFSGKERISLETYVQAARFERVLRRANVRLRVMSGEQYELVRRDTAGDLRSRSGLDLDVIDRYNDSRRPASSLSGGESFIASLCLALGLSDEIQATSGQAQLDTMFVDEGFGSLDETVLEQAMDALETLTESDRLVGIISHVGEIRQRVERQIRVSKTRDGGSTAEICLG